MVAGGTTILPSTVYVLTVSDFEAQWDPPTPRVFENPNEAFGAFCCTAAGVSSHRDSRDVEEWNAQISGDKPLDAEYRAYVNDPRMPHIVVRLREVETETNVVRQREQEVKILPN